MGLFSQSRCERSISPSAITFAERNRQRRSRGGFRTIYTLCSSTYVLLVILLTNVVEDLTTDACLLESQQALIQSSAKTSIMKTVFKRLGRFRTADGEVLYGEFEEGQGLDSTVPVYKGEMPWDLEPTDRTAVVTEVNIFSILASLAQLS